MTYDEFIRNLKDELSSELKGVKINFYQSGYCSDGPDEEKEIRSFNRRYAGEDMPVLLNDLILIRRGTADNITSVFRMPAKDLYTIYQQDGFMEVMKMVKKEIHEFEELKIDFRQLADTSDYETVRSRLILRPLNLDKHRADLHECIYTSVGDVALVLYQILDNGMKTLATSRIHQNKLVEWNLDMEKVIQDALENTSRLFPAVVYDVSSNEEVDFLKTDLCKEDIFMDFHYSGHFFVLLSAKPSVNGALSLFYPGVIEKMMKAAGGPFAAVFMNTVDVMIMPEDSPLIEKALRLGRKPNGFGEKLSDLCYVCDEKGIHPVMT